MPDKSPNASARAEPHMAAQVPGADIDIERVTVAGQKSVMAFAHLHTRLLRNALEVNAHLLDFARKRLEEDIRTNDELCRCDNVSDALEVMSGFYQKAFREYADEANELVRLSAENAKNAQQAGSDALNEANS